MNGSSVVCTLIDISNEHLTKEIGLLSYGFKKYCSCDSFIATYNHEYYPNLKYLPGVRLEFIANRMRHFLPDSLLWLVKNAKRIDILNIYHARISSFLYTFVYKIINHHGKIYLKLDRAPMKKQVSLWKRPLFVQLMKHADCVSTELEENADILSREWGRKIVWVPNPANPNELQPFRPFSQRSNIIFYAGRVERAKGSHTLLEAFAKIAPEIPDWSLQLTGRITENDIPENFCTAHPELKDRVIFTGEIRDRQTLIDMYRDAKIFAFPSRHESFGIALTEAMLQGCFAVTTDIPTSRSLTENFRYALGSPVDDIDGLAKNLLYACTHEAQTEALAREGMAATRERIDLRCCCDVIAEELK